MDRGESQAVSIATKFYGAYSGGRWVLRCAVNGTERPSWHHLDEKKPRCWHQFNIIPLSQDLNLKLDSRTTQPLPVDLRPGILAEKARDHFEKGNLSLGYACARLGAFLAVPPRGDAATGFGPDPDKAAEFCAYALINLRPIAAVPLAIDVLDRSLTPLTSHPGKRRRIEDRTKARLVIEIASYFRDFGAEKEAIRGCNLAASYLDGLTTMADDALRGRIAQHRAIALAGMGDLKGAETWLDRSKEELPEQTVYPEGTPNDVLWRVRVTLQSEKPDLDLCKHLIRGVYGRGERLIIPVWTLAEIFWTDAAILSLSKQPHALDILRKGNDLFHRTGIVPTAILPPQDHAPVPREVPL